MAKAFVQFRADETERLEAIRICERLGIDLPTYLRMCITRLVKEKGVPFSMKLDASGNKGIEALKRASLIAEEEGISEMTLDEINAEITAARKQAGS
ncbi:MAG: toxin-antitoxin system antitoxin subunit [Candidatus Riflebacteria bacterium]|nr:toxin-antitoxin system antitoxin subunit [Candidatus Riflebacteria bacterium]